MTDDRSIQQRDRDAFAANDLLQSGWNPKAADLAAATFIDDWTPARVNGELVLFGKVTGHPSIPDGHVTRTSALLAIHIAGGWARSYSRLYRLGERKLLAAKPASEGFSRKPHAPDSGREMDEETTDAEKAVWGRKP
jgi:hypothetical protein